MRILLEDRMVKMNAAPEAQTVEEYSGVEFPADLERVASVVAKLLAFCMKQGVSAEARAQIEQAVVEAVNNAIEHGCAGIPNARVRLRWSWKNDILEVRVYDPGKFFEGGNGAKLPEDALSEGGRGAFLMETLMDSVEHRIMDGQHYVLMRKRVGEKPACKPKEDTIEGKVFDTGAERSVED